jgi:TRAP-type C4-dicarboxylate transport system substrate-binding protein
MKRSSVLLTAAVLAALVPTGPVAMAADPPITLRLATPEDEERPSQVFLDAFTAEVTRASGGSMTIEIVYAAGGHVENKEPIAAQRVLSGDVDLAVIPSRAWGDVGVSSVQALMAPFLIDSDQLMRAVGSDSSVLQPMVEGMASNGLVGLAIWPETLRHLFTFDENGPPLVAPQDVAGQGMFVIGSALQNQIMTTLGATPSNVFPPDELVQNGTLRGAEYSLNPYNLYSPATVTADVTFYPKFQTLVAEDAAWSRLSADQQQVIRTAATVARERMVGGLPTDANLLQTYCDEGGHAVLAGPANLAAFRTAEQPIYDQMRQDPATAKAIDAISALKTKLAVPPMTTVCEAASQPTLGPIASGPDLGLVPDGTYKSSRTKAELLSQGVDVTTAANNAGDWTLVFNGTDGAYIVDHPSGYHEVCTSTYEDRGDRIRMNDCGEWFDFRWTLNGDQLTLTIVDTVSGTPADVVATQAILGGPWTKVE